MKRRNKCTALIIALCLSIGSVFTSWAAEVTLVGAVQFSNGIYDIVEVDTDLEKMLVGRVSVSGEAASVQDDNLYVYDFQGNLYNKYLPVDYQENELGAYVDLIVHNKRIGKVYQNSADRGHIDWYNMNGEFVSSQVIDPMKGYSSYLDDRIDEEDETLYVESSDDGSFLEIREWETDVLRGNILIENPDDWSGGVYHDYLFLTKDNSEKFFEDGTNINSEIRVYKME